MAGKQKKSKTLDETLKEHEDTGSEFGKGFVYNLFLFAKHHWRVYEQLKYWEEMRKKSPELFSESDALSLWFNGAADHLFELEIPDSFSKTEIGALAKKLQDKGIRYRMCFHGETITKKDFEEFFDDCEKLMRLIDKALGVEDIKATWN